MNSAKIAKIAKTPKTAKACYQVHHVKYNPEITVIVTRAEHYYITRLSWFKSLTPGAKKAIRFILRNTPDRLLNSKD